MYYPNRKKITYKHTYVLTVVDFNTITTEYCINYSLVSIVPRIGGGSLLIVYFAGHLPHDECFKFLTYLHPAWGAKCKCRYFIVKP